VNARLEWLGDITTYSAQALAPSNRCVKPAQFSTWEEYWDSLDRNWTSYDYSDPKTIGATARCPGLSGGTTVFTQRFPRDPTNRYFVAFRQAAVKNLLCSCCQKCAPALRSAPGACPANHTRVDLVAHQSGQVICSICVPGAGLTASGGTLQNFCNTIPGVVRSA
jgi:hypothetical protein